MPERRRDPILIGPVGAGKTTVSALLARELGLPHIEYDRVRRGYFEELGFDMETNLALHAREGWATMYRYWKVFSPYAIERMLAEHRGVLDLGGGAVVCEHIDVLERLRVAFADFDHVVLLTPSLDLDEACRILAPRLEDPTALAHTAAFLAHPSYEALATMTVVTGRRDPEAVAAEVLDRMRQ